MGFVKLRQLVQHTPIIHQYHGTCEAHKSGRTRNYQHIRGVKLAINYQNKNKKTWKENVKTMNRRNEIMVVPCAGVTRANPAACFEADNETNGR